MSWVRGGIFWGWCRGEVAGQGNRAILWRWGFKDLGVHFLDSGSSPKSGRVRGG